MTQTEDTKTRTISLLRGERENCGTKLLFWEGQVTMLALAGREELARKARARYMEIIDWLDSTGIDMPESNGETQ